MIDAFNRDLPYDEFVRLQIAGDVLNPGDLDSLIATGFHVAGTWDQVAHNEGSESMKKAARGTSWRTSSAPSARRSSA